MSKGRRINAWCDDLRLAVNRLLETGTPGRYKIEAHHTVMVEVTVIRGVEISLAGHFQNEFLNKYFGENEFATNCYKLALDIEHVCAKSLAISNLYNKEVELKISLGDRYYKKLMVLNRPVFRA